MEANYGILKRLTLKELFGSPRQIASNKTKAMLIAELMEGDWSRNFHNMPATVETEIDREVQRRLAFYSWNPSEE
ncbi:Hypothetical predicted protein, partial [Pelobates cultripes]